MENGIANNPLPCSWCCNFDQAQSGNGCMAALNSSDIAMQCNRWQINEAYRGMTGADNLLAIQASRQIAQQPMPTAAPAMPAMPAMPPVGAEMNSAAPGEIPLGLSPVGGVNVVSDLAAALSAAPVTPGLPGAVQESLGLPAGDPMIVGTPAPTPFLTPVMPAGVQETPFMPGLPAAPPAAPTEPPTGGVAAEPTKKGRGRQKKNVEAGEPEQLQNQESGALPEPDKGCGCEKAHRIEPLVDSNRNATDLLRTAVAANMAAVNTLHGELDALWDGVELNTEALDAATTKLLHGLKLCQHAIEVTTYALTH